MRTIPLGTLALFSLFSAAALAQPFPVEVVNQPVFIEKDFRFIGYSKAMVAGGAPMIDKALACQADFGPYARWATTEEWLESPFPLTPTSDAWIRPVLGDGELFNFFGSIRICKRPDDDLPMTFVEAEWGNIDRRPCFNDGNPVELILACSAPVP